MARLALRSLRLAVVAGALMIGAFFILVVSSGSASADESPDGLVSQLVGSPSADPTGLGQVIDPVTAPLTPATKPVTRALAPVTKPVVTELSPVTKPVTNAVQPVTEPVVTAVARIAKPVTKPVAQAVAPVTTAVAKVAQPVTKPLVAAAAGVAPITTPVSGVILTPLVDAAPPATTAPVTTMVATGHREALAAAPVGPSNGDVGRTLAVSIRPGILSQPAPAAALSAPSQHGIPTAPVLPTVPSAPGAPATGGSMVVSGSNVHDAAAAILSIPPPFALALLGQRTAADDHVGVQPGHQPGVSPD